jgi:hypothetical protein
MPTSDDTSISALKGATGVADDRLSAHNPNGTGNQTKIGDFIINALGGNTDPSTQSVVDGKYLLITEINKADGTTINDPSVTFNANGNSEYTFDNNVVLEPGDDFKLEVWVEKDINKGEHFRNAIGKRVALWTELSTDHWSLNDIVASDRNDGNSYYSYALDISFDSYETPLNVQIAYDLPFNTSAPVLGGGSAVASLAFKTSDVNVDLDLDFSSSPGSSYVDLTYSINNGVPDFDVNVKKRKYGESSYNTIYTATETSTTTTTFQDSNVSSGTTYEYELNVTDSDGNNGRETTSETPISTA